MTKKKITFVIGTRPEVIKMAPVIQAFEAASDRYEVSVCLTGQHRDLSDQAMRWFGLTADHDLDLMKANQSLSHVTTRVLEGLESIFRLEKPDLVFVQGDTTSTFGGALAAFYQKIAVAYVESGLRTYDRFNPFPEEMNRTMTTDLADLHFAPTEQAAEHLKRENIPADRVIVTGNTVIDSLLMTARKSDVDVLKTDDMTIDLTERFLLVTAHRRESFGAPMESICRAIKALAMDESLGVKIIFPVHPNPLVKKIVFSILGGVSNIHLIDPQDYPTFVNLMAKAYLLLTDSGGVQEEAPSLNKPVLVLRDTTERPEGVQAGTLKLVGTDESRIIEATRELLIDDVEYTQMAEAPNPYGDGTSAQKILESIDHYFA